MALSNTMGWMHQPLVLCIFCLVLPAVAGFSALRQAATHAIRSSEVLQKGSTTSLSSVAAGQQMMPALSVTRSPGTLALAGQIFSTIQRLAIGRSKAKMIFLALVREAHVGDLAVLSVLGYGSVPLMKYIRKLRFPEDSETAWLQCPACRVAMSISQLCCIGGIVYAVDMLAVALSTIGFQFPMRMKIPTVTGQIGFAVWFAVNLAAIKQSLLCRFLKVDSPEKLGRSSVYDRLGDGVIYFAALLVVMDIMSVETGRAMSSVFALGSVGTLVFSLASKDIAANFVSGLALSASNKFHVGEDVRIGNEYQGVVHKMGWMHTDIRGYDEIITRVPNSEVANLKVSNISRIGRSQVKQTLYFDYKDIDKIGDIITDIKTEISRSCPKLVTDGTRPFFCHWREFKETKLEVVVDTHFTIRHGCAEYFDTRQTMLQAISRAAKKNDVKFALPIISIRNGDASTLPSDASEILSFPDPPPIDGSAMNKGTSQ